MLQAGHVFPELRNDDSCAFCKSNTRNHKSKNDNCYAFYKVRTPATVRCRGITSPKMTTVLHFATTKNKKSPANQIEKSQANPGRSHKRTLYLCRWFSGLGCSFCTTLWTFRLPGLGCLGFCVFRLWGVVFCLSDLFSMVQQL